MIALLNQVNRCFSSYTEIMLWKLIVNQKYLQWKIHLVHQSSEHQSSAAQHCVEYRVLPHGLPERLGRISYHILLALEKIKIQSMLSTEWLSFMYFCKVIKMCIRHICIVYEIVQSVWRRLSWYMIAANWEKRMQKIVLIRREIIVLFYSENISFTELWLILSSQSRESLSVLTAPIITVSLCRREHFGKTLLN